MNRLLGRLTILSVVAACGGAILAQSNGPVTVTLVRWPYT